MQCDCCATSLINNNQLILYISLHKKELCLDCAKDITGFIDDMYQIFDRGLSLDLSEKHLDHIIHLMKFGNGANYL